MSKKNEKGSLPGQIVRNTSRAGMGGGAILIALALFMLFKGLGPGGTGASGSGTGKGPTSTEHAKATVGNDDASTEPESTLAAPESVVGGLTDDERKALSGDLLTVLIDDFQYMIELPGNPDSILRPAELSRIVQLASLAKGDSNGIKVRVLIRQSARASAESQLLADLEHSGIHRDAIMMTSEFVP
jgi:hypothetical protein